MSSPTDRNTPSLDELIELLDLCKFATKVSPLSEREDRGDGEERYIVKGVPCGFPVAKFGDYNDAELFIAAATKFRPILESLLADRAKLEERVRELETARGLKIEPADPVVLEED